MAKMAGYGFAYNPPYGSFLSQPQVILQMSLSQKLPCLTHGVQSSAGIVIT
jgi:hypothetical protein